MQVRTKHDPLKWPILDKNGEVQHITALNLVPPPPMPKTFRMDLQNENLNPNVAEFVPNEGEKEKSKSKYVD